MSKENFLLHLSWPLLVVRKHWIFVRRYEDIALYRDVVVNACCQSWRYVHSFAFFKQALIPTQLGDHPLLDTDVSSHELQSLTTEIDSMKDIDDGFCNDSSMAPNPAVAMLWVGDNSDLAKPSLINLTIRIAIPMIVYAFCGVEIVAVTALEAKTPEKSLRSTLTRYFTPMLTVVYIVTALLSYLDVSWKDPLLVSLPRKACNPESLIIIVAKNAKILILPGFLNGCLILAVLSAANTSLYVASRTLFGLTRGLKKSNRTKFENLVCCLGTTNSRGVPVYALAFSVTICGIWLPVVHFEQGYNDQPVKLVSFVLDYRPY